MMKLRLLFSAIALLAVSYIADAQRFTVSTNVLDYACLGTMNVEGSYALSRRWSLSAGARYNPFTFRASDPQRQFQIRQISCSAGVRMWPWHTSSGWWFAGKARYQEYNYGGITSRATREGDRVGAGLYAGYTHMLGPHFNLEFGLGAWAGMDWYDIYSCQVCGLTVDSGNGFFVLPDDIMVAVVYVF